MIIARSPLRITLGGGGTDLPSYYREYEGFVISAAIDKYVYVCINKPYKSGIFLRYSKIEEVKKISDINHNIIREVLLLKHKSISKIEITTLSDIPAGTGLGSSGSFSTAMIKAFYGFLEKKISQDKLARLACEIEIDKLNAPIGKQDQYISAIGGITCFKFFKNDNVKYFPLKLSLKTQTELESNLLLYFTGYSRNANDILKHQKEQCEKNNKDIFNNLHYIKNLGLQTKNALENGKTKIFGEIMNEHWKYKKKRLIKMSNEKIDYFYDFAIKNGAIGGKLIGAGGGGFLMFMASDKDKLRKNLTKIGLQEVRFKFDMNGTKIINL